QSAVTYAHGADFGGQRERCRAYCRALGYDVLEEKEDEGAGDRPGLREAIRQACAARAVLVVDGLGRLARTTREALAVLGGLEGAGAALACVAERLDTRAPGGLVAVLAAFDKLARERGRERTSQAMRRHQREGRRMTRPDRCPLGRMPDPADPARLTDHPEE